MAPGSILTPSLHLRWVGKFGGTQRIESQSPSFALVSHTSAGIALILLSVNEDESSSELDRWWSHCTQSTPSSSFSTPQGCERRHTHEDKLEHNMLGCTQTNTEHSWTAHRLTDRGEVHCAVSQTSVVSLILATLRSGQTCERQATKWAPTEAVESKTLRFTLLSVTKHVIPWNNVHTLPKPTHLVIQQMWRGVKKDYSVESEVIFVKTQFDPTKGSRRLISFSSFSLSFPVFSVQIGDAYSPEHQANEIFCYMCFWNILFSGTDTGSQTQGL